MQLLQLRQQHMVCFSRGCNVHDAGEGIIAALALIDVIVGVHHLAAQRATQQLNRPAGTQ